MQRLSCETDPTRETFIRDGQLEVTDVWGVTSLRALREHIVVKECKFQVIAFFEKDGPGFGVQQVPRFREDSIHQRIEVLDLIQLDSHTQKPVDAQLPLQIVGIVVALRQLVARFLKRTVRGAEFGLQRFVCSPN